MLVLTDRPEQAHWLGPEERAWLSGEMAREQQARLRHGASWQSLLDPKVLLVCLIYFLNTTVTYGLFLWLPQMIEEAFGGRRFVAVMIPFAFALVAMVLVGRHSDKTGERKWHVAGSAFVASLGLLLAAAFRSDPWMLEYHEDGHLFRAAGHVTLDRARQAFQSYLAGGPEWRTGFEWREVVLKTTSPDGVVTTYHPSGSLMSEAVCVGGVRHGPYRDFWPNGRVSLEGQYRDGLQEGEWRFYDQETGEVREVMRGHVLGVAEIMGTYRR